MAANLPIASRAYNRRNARRFDQFRAADKGYLNHLEKIIRTSLTWPRPAVRTPQR